jgi:DUF1009 family protein
LGYEIKKNKMGGLVAFMEDGRMAYGVLEGNMKERDNFRDLGVDVRILNWILKKKRMRGSGVNISGS